ncbi:2Fe-2S iron-sulfur cluster-binding protein [Bordetella sp. 15P40C-2]|uniref:2Fe-2S iron-sulfur cluster-binding protein n=1 Tax=Bordetella sp. 15P40C-2 TaxID=2572246 RepID=UPI001329ADAC|nr:2Fe-2S iron-sulfur cluster-binding protein [Bordetella sp. 15P40C-2]MVW70284.1 2Fe-2S iron-sulfur cluster binding domain-containing protein [Bordetella sp. 15P40C-2]
MAHRVLWLQSQQQFEVSDGETLLDAASRQGVELPHECTFGGCGTCRIQVLEGRVDYEELPLALTEEEHAQGVGLACQARAMTDLVISVERSTGCSDPTLLEAEVADVRLLSHDVYHLQLRLPDEHGIVYRPGQYLNIHLDDASHRSFSMANPPDAGRVDLQIRRIQGGYFTDRLLSQMQPGHRLSVEMPHGAFYYRAQDYRPMVFAATGTGIAPIKAILESLLDDDDCPPVSLYWGMRNELDLYLAEQIESWRDRLYEFEFVPVLSRPSGQWQGRKGYVQDAVLQDLPDLSEHSIYLCGSPLMIQDAKTRFVGAGAEAAHLYSDSFIFQSR